MPSSDASKYAPTAWGLAQFLELEFPSGQLALVKRPGVPQLVAAGILDSADALGALVNQKHIKRTKNGPPQIDGASMLKDTTNLMTVMQLVDKITAFMVVEPKVVEIWVEETAEDGHVSRRAIRDDERESGVVYCDAIDLADRMFLFQWAIGGTVDLATFRERFKTAMGSVEAQQGVPSAAK
jgi:hypothetical protein